MVVTYHNEYIMLNVAEPYIKKCMCMIFVFVRIGRYGSTYVLIIMFDLHMLTWLYDFPKHESQAVKQVWFQRRIRVPSEILSVVQNSWEILYFTPLLVQDTALQVYYNG